MKSSACSRGLFAGHMAGYTFVELAVVLTLLLLVVGITVPRFARIVADNNVGSAARRFAGEVLYLRNLAAKNGRTFYINIDPPTNSYRVLVKKPLSEIEAPEDFDYLDYYEYQQAMEENKYKQYSDGFVGTTRLRGQVEFLDVMLADGTVVKEEPVKIAFYPDGKADKVAVHFTNSKNDFYTVEIRPFTARPKVFEIYRELQEEIDLGYEEEEEEEEE